MLQCMTCDLRTILLCHSSTTRTFNHVCVYDHASIKMMMQILCKGLHTGEYPGSPWVGSPRREGVSPTWRSHPTRPTPSLLLATARHCAPMEPCTLLLTKNQQRTNTGTYKSQQVGPCKDLLRLRWRHVWVGLILLVRFRQFEIGGGGQYQMSPKYKSCILELFSLFLFLSTIGKRYFHTNMEQQGWGIPSKTVTRHVDVFATETLSRFWSWKSS